MDDPVPVQVIQPEWKRSGTYRVDSGLNLARTRAALYPVIGKRGHGRSRLGLSVGVIEVVVSVAAVKQNGLFDQALTDHLREEIDVFLRTAGADHNVVSPVTG